MGSILASNHKIFNQMIQKNYPLFVLLLFLCLTSSCGNDDDVVECTSTEVSERFNDLIDDVISASTTYANDESSANCNKLKDTFRTFIDEMRTLQNCADEVGQGAEWRESIQEAETDLDDLNC